MACQQRERERPGDPHWVEYYAGMTLILWPSWALFCVVGVFAGNIIPANRIDPNGQKLLSIFPLPNINAATVGYNYNNVFQSTVDQPRREEILRVDWNISSKTTFYARGIQNYEAFKGDFNFVLASNVWPQFPIKYQIESRGLVSTLIHSFTPTLTNEFTFGIYLNQEINGTNTIFKYLLQLILVFFQYLADGFGSNFRAIQLSKNLLHRGTLCFSGGIQCGQFIAESFDLGIGKGILDPGDQLPYFFLAE